MFINRKPGFFVAVVRRLPNGRGIKAPRDHSGKNPELLSAFPNDTTLDNVKSYYKYWSKRRTNFINYGSCSSSTSAADQKRWIHFNSLKTTPTLNSDEQLDSLEPPLSPYDTGNRGVSASNNQNNTEAAEESRTARVTPLRELGVEEEKSDKKEKKEIRSPPPSKFTTASLDKKHQQNIPITMITAYDYPSAQIADSAGIDMILVGDSVAMVVLGHEDTLQVNMEEMLHHCKSVARGSKRAFLVGDMPFGSYLTVESAVNNAARFIKEGRMDAIKLEGGMRVEKQVKAIVDAGIVVIGHIGLTPQSYRQLGGFKVQGKSKEEAERIIDDAKALEAAGVSAIVLEMVPTELAAKITETISIPTIGIGAGPACSGQVLVFHDICGLYDKLQPKFSKCYTNARAVLQKAVEGYKADVISRKFPSLDHSFSTAVKAPNNIKQIPAQPSMSLSQSELPTTISQYSPKFGAFPANPMSQVTARLARAPFSDIATKSDPKRIVIIGGGSMGSLFAGKMATDNPSNDVWLLTGWKDHSEAISRSSGLSVKTGSSALKSPVNVANSAEALAGSADIVFIMVKAPETLKAADFAKQVAKPNSGIVVTLQNGIGGKDVVDQVLQGDNKHYHVYGVTSQAASIQAPGEVLHNGEGPTILVSQKDQEEQARIVASVLTSGGIPTSVKSESEGEAILWSKLLVNACINPLSALFRVNNGKLLDTPYSRLLTELVKETTDSAKALGIPTTYPLDQLSDQVRTTILKTKDNENSMVKDINLDKPTEFDSINGKLLWKAKQSNSRAPLPVNNALNTIFAAMAGNGPQIQSSEGMKVVDTISAYRELRASFEKNEVVGFVPTMGALHEGHLTLVRKAKENCDKVIVSVFVNPTQFAPHEDLQKYPRPIEADLKLLKSVNVDAVFLPSDKEMYPRKQSIFVVPNNIEAVSAESFARPHFFRGVGTVCSKLFNIITPHKAFFGQKDAVQAILLKNLVRELNFPVDIEIVDTVREHDGLAMSSRNVYLAPEHRQTAPIIYKSLQAAENAFEKGERSVKELKNVVQNILTSSPLVDLGYISLADGDTAAELADDLHLLEGQVALLSVAVVIGKTRLIDNILLGK